MSQDNVFSEIYSAKSQRIRYAPIVKCGECGEFTHHKLDCSNNTKELMQKRIDSCNKRVGWANKRAHQFLKEMQAMAGKLAMLKAENNKLRKKSNFLYKSFEEWFLDREGHEIAKELEAAFSAGRETK